MLEITSLIFSVVALIISSGVAIKGWWRHRNIYELELFDFPGSMAISTKEINEKLSSGDYTIMHTEKSETGYQILLGKIKK